MTEEIRQVIVARVQGKKSDDTFEDIITDDAGRLQVWDPKVGSLISYTGTTTADGGAGGSSLIDALLAAEPEFNGNLVVITSGAFAGQGRWINGTTLAGTVTPDANFDGVIVTGVTFTIFAINVAVAMAAFNVPGINAATNILMRDVTGNKADTAIAVPDNLSSAMRYLKGLLAQITALRMAELDPAGLPADVAAVAAQLVLVLADTATLLADVALVQADTTTIIANQATILADIALVQADTTALIASLALVQADTTAILANQVTILANQALILADTATLIANLALVQADTTAILVDTATIIAAIAAIDGGFQEQASVAVNVNANNAGETTVFDLSAANTRYLVRSLRLTCVDPGLETVTVRLYELINAALILVDSFAITTANFATAHSLMDMFGLPHLAGDNLKVTVIATAVGPYAVTGRYSFATAT